MSINIGQIKLSEIDEDIFILDSFDIEDKKSIIIIENHDNDMMECGLYNSLSRKIEEKFEFFNIYSDVEYIDTRIVQRENRRYYLYVFGRTRTDDLIIYIYEISLDHSSISLINEVTYPLPNTYNIEYIIANDNKYIDTILNYDLNNTDITEFIRFEIQTERIYEVRFTSIAPGINPLILSDNSRTTCEFISLVEANAVIAMNKEHFYMYNRETMEYISRSEVSEIFPELIQSSILNIETLEESSMHGYSNSSAIKINVINNITGNMEKLLCSFYVYDYQFGKFMVSEPDSVESLFIEYNHENDIDDSFQLGFRDFIITSQKENFIIASLRYYYFHASGYSSFVSYDVALLINLETFEHQLITDSFVVGSFISTIDISSEDLLTAFFSFGEPTFSHETIIGSSHFRYKNQIEDFVGLYIGSIPYSASFSNICKKENVLDNVRAGWEINNPIEYGTDMRLGDTVDPLNCGTVVSTKTVKKEDICTFMVQ